MVPLQTAAVLQPQSFNLCFLVGYHTVMIHITTSCCATGGRSSCAPCSRLTKLGKGFFRDKYYEYLVHVCADFDAMLRHDWRRLGISAEEVREFCVWRNAPMRVLSSQGDLVDSYDPVRKERLRRALLHVQGREAGAGAAGGARAGEARQTPRSGGAWTPRRWPGLIWCEDLREARRQLMAAGESPKAAICEVLRAQIEAGREDPRARGAAALVRGAGAGVPGPAPGRAGARDLPGSC